MMEIKVKLIGYLSVAVALLLALSMVYADTQQTTLTWVIPANVTHALTYGGSCSTSAMYFVESNALEGATPINGTASKIPPYNAASGGSSCQDGTNKVAITIHNQGNVPFDINARITTTLETGVTLKAWLSNGTHCGTNGMGGWEATCSKSGTDDDTVPTTTACVTIGNTTKQIIADLAISSSAGICLAADFSGMPYGTTQDTLETEAVQSFS
ncbi:MAG: hypothetical protein N3F05_04805 [Candidatus Diapherotrites archaeon]|nr:hypothetical protein [Candidatus Diapherotrites archaeon]